MNRLTSEKCHDLCHVEGSGSFGVFNVMFFECGSWRHHVSFVRFCVVLLVMSWCVLLCN